MKALFYSIATAGVAGLLTGGGMKLGPDAFADRPEGPQILISGASKRVIDNDGWYADAIFTAYNGDVPEHVLGTDWTRPVSYDAAYEDYSYDVAYEGDSDYEPAPEPTEQAAYEPPAVKVSTPPELPAEPAPQHAQVTYPSRDGDILGGLHGWPAPAQVVTIAETEDAYAS